MAVRSGNWIKASFLTVASNEVFASYAAIPNPDRMLTVFSLHGLAVPSGVITSVWDTPFIASVAGSPQLNGQTQYVCTGWAGTGSVTNCVGTNVSFNLADDSTLSWLWQTNYWLDTAVNGSGSVDIGDGWFGEGSAVLVTATVDQYYRLSGWSGNTNGCATNGSSITLGMSLPRGVAADFGAVLAPLGTPEWWVGCSMVKPDPLR